LVGNEEGFIDLLELDSYIGIKFIDRLNFNGDHFACMKRLNDKMIIGGYNIGTIHLIQVDIRKVKVNKSKHF